MKKIIYYLARILSILIVLFFGLFVLEGFSPMFSWQDSLWHLLLTLIVLIFVIISWLRPAIGGWLLIILGIIAAGFFHPLFWNGLLIGLIFWIVGIFFLLAAKR